MTATTAFAAALWRPKAREIAQVPAYQLAFASMLCGDLSVPQEALSGFKCEAFGSVSRLDVPQGTQAAALTCHAEPSLRRTPSYNYAVYFTGVCARAQSKHVQIFMHSYAML